MSKQTLKTEQKQDIILDSLESEMFPKEEIIVVEVIEEKPKVPRGYQQVSMETIVREHIKYSRHKKIRKNLFHQYCCDVRCHAIELTEHGVKVRSLKSWDNFKGFAFYTDDFTQEKLNWAMS